MNPEQQAAQPEEQPNTWAYTSGDLIEQGEQTQPQTSSANPDSEEPLITWTASEFVEHDKSMGWYVTLFAGAIFLSVVMYFATQQILSVVVVVLMAVVFAVYGSAKPRILTYTITPAGLMVADKFYGFNALKSFSVINEEGMPYIQVLFQKRLSIPMNVYAAPDQLEHVADVIGKFVPYDQKTRDIADKLSSRIRF